MTSKNQLFQNGRLVKSAFPTNYKIVIDPDFDKCVFDAIVEISINCVNHMFNSVALHSENLKIKKILLDNNTVNFEEDEKNNLLIIHNSAQFLTSNHKLRIYYNGIISTDMKGFYKSIYTHNGKEKNMFSTQLEAVGCRRVLPCWDEPSFKSTFDLVILSPHDKTILSNTNIKNVKQLKNGKNVTIFETTPLMSSYLLAFAIGDFEYVEKITKHDVKIRIYAPEGDNREKLDFALTVTSNALDWYENWFGIRYPLSKLDSLSVFSFDAGAMENWGLITFRPELLYVTADTTLADKQNVVVTICHELAHQWFGNLSTMYWWDNLWLNESMATYYGWLVTDELFPEWNVWNKFMDTEYSYAFRLDGLESSHPIEVPIENSKDINQIFDGISYSKGSCVIRFLINYLGDDIFRKGMQHYMKTHAYKNTTSNDLWDSFDHVLKITNNNDAVPTSIKNMMDTWIKQTGYPVVTLYKDNNLYKLKQERYLTSGPNSDKTTWIIPVKLYIDGTDSDIELISHEPVTIGNANTIIVNPNRIGFYRVRYDTVTFDFHNLSKQMQKQILDDNFSLCSSGYQGFYNTFDLITKLDLNSLKDYELWTTVITNLLSVRNLFTKHKSAKDNIEKYIKNYIVVPARSLLQEIGLHDIENEPINNTDLRPLLINFLATMKDKEIIDYAKKCFHDENYKYILPIVGEHATNSEYQKLLKLFSTESDNNPQLKDELLRAIACTKNPDLIDYTINNFLIQQVREQDLWHMIFNLIVNEHATEKTWLFITNNWNTILSIYEAGSSGLSSTIKVISRGFFTEEELNMYTSFFTVRPDGTNMVVEQSIESLKNKINSINKILADKEFMNFINV
jgi:aminopeptidase N